MPATLVMLLTATVSPILFAFLAWLMFSLTVDSRYPDDPERATRIIESTGRWFPFRMHRKRRGSDRGRTDPADEPRAAVEPFNPQPPTH